MNWQPGEILLVVTDGGRYNEVVQELAQTVDAHPGRGVLIAANRPHAALASALSQSLDYVDCISGLTGFMPPNQPGVIYIESPTMLEKAALRAEQMLRRMEDPAGLIVDSLSTLAMYNDADTVAELAHNLITRLRTRNIGAALIVVDGTGGGLIDALAPYCDRQTRVRSG
ncbi:MAG: DUF7504 family protein [Thermoplasmatota archaeon]